jgi:hypothetical protein
MADHSGVNRLQRARKDEVCITDRRAFYVMAAACLLLAYSASATESVQPVSWPRGYTVAPFILELTDRPSFRADP